MDSMESASGGITPDHILQLGLGFFGSKALLSAVELGVFPTLSSKGPLTWKALEAELNLHHRSSRDFFDALVALKVLERNGDDPDSATYRNSPASEAFLVPGKRGCVSGILNMANARLYPFWNELTAALRDGSPKNEASKGGDIFAAVYGDPNNLRVFLEAMSGISNGANTTMAAKLDLCNVKTLCDVGCAQGDLVVEMAKAHQSIQCIGFDLPPVEPIFNEYVAKAGLSARVRFEAGDFFKQSLPAADVITMGHILHDWGLEDKRMLLRKAFEALPSGGRLVLHEALIDDARRENASGLLMSLNMLIETREGFDYSAADARVWLAEAGFSKDITIESLPGSDSMIIAKKP